MSLVQDVTPVNLLEEKEKFFADPSYNPQFTYRRELSSDELYKHGQPKQEYVDLASEIHAESFFNKTEADITRGEGPVMTENEVREKIELFLRMHNLEERYRFVFSTTFVARASVNNSEIKLRLPLLFREQSLLGMIYHELGTHALRRINYEAQPFFKKKKKYGFGSYLLTEEGLAVIHSLIPHQNKLAYRAASYYLASSWAQTHSFSQLWEKIGTFIDDPQRRWNWTLRQKRGLSDTSQPGGFTKDLVYFEGLVEVWQWLHAHQFDSSDLYRGKIALEDVELAKKLNPDFQPLLPSFFSVDPERYAEQILTIGQANHLDQTL